ncbi:MAG: hypothetical protein Ta2E_09330 [Mycoplasmoidaceae bacterium]|nr:MAG: hypothetical protein Ta2E_09330 [Mycoplasmoidaceae bacterium]
MKYIEEEQKIQIWNEKNIKVCDMGETAKKISMLLNDEHYEHLTQQKLRGQAMCTFKNSVISNFYIGNCKAPTKDYLLRFSIRARNDTLWTPAKKAIMNRNNNPYCNCQNHRYCNTLHILNNCMFNMKGMTERHDKVQNRMVEAIEKHRKVAKDEVKVNKAVWIDGLDMEECTKMRPDIQFWTKELENGIEVNTLNMIEVAIPFGRTLEEKGNTLEVKRKEKTDKYSPMVKKINMELENKSERGKKFQVVFEPIIVSSFGAVPNTTVKALERLLKCSKYTVHLWAKRMCVDALIGSFGIWIKAKDGIYELMKSRKSLRDIEDDKLAQEGEEGNTNDNLRELVNESTSGDEIDEKKKIRNSTEDPEDEINEDCLSSGIEKEADFGEIAVSEDEEIREMYEEGNEVRYERERQKNENQNDWWVFVKQDMKMFKMVIKPFFFF